MSNTNAWHGQSSFNHDFPDHCVAYDPKARDKRMALVAELRQSNIPSQNYDIPRTTFQDSYVKSNKEKEADLMVTKKVKADAKNIKANMNGIKPNFNLGAFKMDYTSENRGSIKQPIHNVFDRSVIAKAAATQRQHNFSLSFE